MDLSKVNGKITFQNINLSNFNEDDRLRIIKLQPTGKVIIERGCIKYRLQTSEKEIKIYSDNQLLIDEITSTYKNFFISNTGKNLGVEIVERTEQKIVLFYFSDENISQEQFESLLWDSSRSFLGIFSNFNHFLNKKHEKGYFINAINGAISLMTVSLRASLLIAVGKWTENDTNALINSINPSSTNALVSQDLHLALSKMDLPDTFKKLIASNSLNMITINQITQNGHKSIYIENNNREEI